MIVVALVANATWSFGRSSLKGWRHTLLAAAAAAYLAAGRSPILAVAGAAAASLLLYRGAAASKAIPPAATSRRRGALQAVALIAAAPVSLGALFVFDRQLFRLAGVMMKVDLFAFGGGFASSRSFSTRWSRRGLGWTGRPSWTAWPSGR
jgi:chromate transporter